MLDRFLDRSRRGRRLYCPQRYVVMDYITSKEHPYVSSGHTAPPSERHRLSRSARTHLIPGTCQDRPPGARFGMKTTADLYKLESRSALADYRGKWLILFFYPLDFTFVCPTEILALSDRYDEFVELGADVLGVSTDSVYSHRAWINTPRERNGIAGLRYPLAADITKQVARDYGVLVEDQGIALRGLFIIDPHGVLQ